MQVDYYFSTMSPWTYLAGQRLEKIAARHGAQVMYRPLDILALFAQTGGTAPKDRHPNRQAYRAQELRRWAARLGMPLTLAPAHFPTNAAPSSYAILSAQRAGGGDLGALVHGITRACWVEERDIAQDDVIRDVLQATGFDPALSSSGLLQGADEYGANLDRAVAVGVFGAPFYITDHDERFWGQDRLPLLEDALAARAGGGTA